MIVAGNSFIELMHERGAVLMDTETILGDPKLGYTGQPDKSWLILNKEKTGFGLVITDWKTNQPKNFKVMPYTDKMYKPFDGLSNNALGHYQVQLPLYGKLILEMLKGSKYEDLKILGCIIVLLKENGTFEEYKVPSMVNNNILRMDIKKYLK